MHLSGIMYFWMSAARKSILGGISFRLDVWAYSAVPVVFFALEFVMTISAGMIVYVSWTFLCIIYIMPGLMAAGGNDHPVVAPIPRPQRQAMARTKMLTACMLMEADTVGVIYDYNRARAGVAMAVEYVNDYVMIDGYYLRVLFRDIGPECSGKTHIVGHAMDLMQQSIRCDVYIGPGLILNDYADFYDIHHSAVLGGLGYSAPASVYTVTARISITYSTIADALLRFFKHFNYQQTLLFGRHFIDLIPANGHIGENYY
ncbi:hypothetical protein BV898_13359 [Hypsibius exemplaris]|uniref:Receptor ligand binding region domain-containing protein n=1 Tax=Hypsibius exemplaris TaxID=2072580 RepID=A0A1W0WB62_HYPEX|nr:hypothetical protein BV898_13359 [Hypsibius exemplaris]